MAFDKAQIRWYLRRQRVPGTTNKKKKKVVGVLEEPEIKLVVGIQEGSALSPLLFIIVMEDATKECRKGGLWKML